MTNHLTKNILISSIDWAYDKAVNGGPLLDSAQEIAQTYLSGVGTLHEKTNSLIRWQNTKAGTSGFLSGLGGLITMPVTIPANLASVIYVQLRMIAAIAYMGGHDLRNDQVRTLCYACLTGNAMAEIIKEVGIRIGQKLTVQTIKNISRATIVEINKKVGFRLLTKFGEKGIVNLGKAIPLIGGIIGGGIDLITTNTIGNIARDTFIGVSD